MRTVYAILYCIIFPFFNLVHPCRAVGREHIPEGGVLVCAKDADEDERSRVLQAAQEAGLVDSTAVILN